MPKFNHDYEFAYRYKKSKKKKAKIFVILLIDPFKYFNQYIRDWTGQDSHSLLRAAADKEEFAVFVANLH